jgi:Tfp pilus assembly pilus retraction ATPase PilT
MRDAETAETALHAAESGHLVLSTMHTINAAETIGRVIEFFRALKQAQVRSILAGCSVESSASASSPELTAGSWQPSRSWSSTRVSPT